MVLPTHKGTGKGEKVCILGVRMQRFIVSVKFKQLVSFEVSNPVKVEGTCRDQTEGARHDSSAQSPVRMLFRMTSAKGLLHSLPAASSLRRSGAFLKTDNNM